MISMLATAALVCAASVAIGGAVTSLCGWRDDGPSGLHPSWLSPPVGIAALLAVATLASRLPGRSVTAAVALALGTLAAVAYLARSHLGWRGLVPGLPPALLAALGAALPFIVNDRVGILGVGLVNDDMASHLLVADWVQNATEPTPSLVEGGYPLGPHSLVAALAEGLGADPVNVFAGLTLAIAALGAMTAQELLCDLRPLRRTLAATLAALPYLGAAYLAQGAFKEPLQALFLIGFALGLARLRRPARWGGDVDPFASPAAGLAVPALPLGVIAAGSVFNYSFPGLFWLAGTAAAAWFFSGAPVARLRALLPIAAVVVAAAAAITLVDWGRIADFLDFRAFARSGEQALGNLRHSISPLEVLGVWPSGEFRISPADATLPAAAFYLGGLLAAVALGVGLWRALYERRFELPAALAIAAAIYAGAAALGTPYTSAKALAIAAPVAMLVAVRGVLDTDWLPIGSVLRRPRIPPRIWRRALIALAAAFCGAATLSSFLALRQGPVSPGVHAGELNQVRPLTDGGRVLFLGRDDFIAWELRGAKVDTPLQNYYNVGEAPARFDLGPGTEKFDFDAVEPGVLDRYRFVLTTSSAYAGKPPGNLREVLSTPSYTLWKRRGPTGRRPTLDEGAAPGAVLRCRDRGPEGIPAGATLAAVWPRPPAEGPERRWRPEATLAPGAPATQSLKLSPGRWEVALAYDSPRPLELTLSGPGIPTRMVADGQATFALPANLDFRGPTPVFPAGRIAVKRRGPVKVEVELAEAPLAGRLLGAEGEAHLRLLVAAPLGRIRHVPPQRACGRYVDWLRRSG